ncbi:MAG: flippase-like domain-containing protein [Gammaproteobacteria bacterium]|nr:flippase-like domain-containing protein [Gammaproteobacteria bacterium]MDH5800090.1 flippase-like domain-containing protein [Gammaproteobacteria bacterium]
MTTLGSQQKRKPSTAWLVVLKLLITTGLLIWIFHKFDLKNFQHTLETINHNYVLLAFVLHTIAYVIFALRWWTLLRITKDCPFSRIVPAYYLGLFWNNFLPTAVGGDVVRIIKLRNSGFNTGELILSSMADRAIGLYSILVLGAVAFVANTQLHIPELNFTWTLLTIVLIIGGSVALLSTRCLRFFSRLFSSFENFRPAKFALSALDTVKLYVKNKSILIYVFFYSFSAQFLIILSYMLLGAALNLNVPYGVFFAVIPVVFVASSIPISIGGLGVRESVLISLLSLYAVNPQASMALSIVYFSMLILITLPGAVFIFNLQRHSQPYDKICQ